MILFNLTLSQHFETETQDLSGLEWSPNGCVLAVWDSCLEVSPVTKGYQAGWVLHALRFFFHPDCKVLVDFAFDSQTVKESK